MTLSLTSKHSLSLLISDTRFVFKSFGWHPPCNLSAKYGIFKGYLMFLGICSMGLGLLVSGKDTGSMKAFAKWLQLTPHLRHSYYQVITAKSSAS
jgi:hypothetical protein